MGFQVPNFGDVAYRPLATLYASDFAILEAALEGTFVLSGGAVTAASGLNVAVAAVTVENAGAQYDIAAAASNALPSAPTSNPKWVLVEQQTGGTLSMNAGTEAAAPVPPAPTSGRVVLAAVFMPVGCTAVDSLLGTANGNAKIVDKRVLRAAGVVDLRIYTASGTATWTKPAGARRVHVQLWGSGGGGGSGRCGAAASLRGGGSGGGSGMHNEAWFEAADLSSTETVTVGAKGTGGAAVGSSAADGNDGGAGNDSTFGTKLKASGGGAGLKGTSTAGGAAPTASGWYRSGGHTNTGGAGSDGSANALAGADGSATTGAIGAYAGNPESGGGGGGGGGLPTGNTERTGGRGGYGFVKDTLATLRYGAAGAVHAAGGAPSATTNRPGGGGGGGGSSSSSSVNGGAGADGSRASGGGGGGAGTSGGSATSGKGGDGGDGLVIVVTYA